MQYLSILLKLLPYLVELIRFAQKVFGPGTGEAKKAFVATALKDSIGAVKGISEGGQKETWEILEEPLSSLIDAAVKFVKTNDSDDMGRA